MSDSQSPQVNASGGLGGGLVGCMTRSINKAVMSCWGSIVWLRSSRWSWVVRGGGGGLMGVNKQLVEQDEG